MKGFQPKRFKTQRSKLENILQKFLFPRWSSKSPRLSSPSSATRGILFSLHGFNWHVLSFLTNQEIKAFELSIVYYLTP